MRRYFFTLANSDTQRDDEGTLLPDDQTARAAAVRFLADFLRDEPDLVWHGHRLAVQVDDEDGRRVMEVVVHATSEPHNA